MHPHIDAVLRFAVQPSREPIPFRNSIAHKKMLAFIEKKGNELKEELPGNIRNCENWEEELLRSEFWNTQINERLDEDIYVAARELVPNLYEFFPLIQRVLDALKYCIMLELVDCMPSPVPGENTEQRCGPVGQSTSTAVSGESHSASSR